MREPLFTRRLNSDPNSSRLSIILLCVTPLESTQSSTEVPQRYTETFFSVDLCVTPLLCDPLCNASIRGALTDALPYS